MWSFFRRLYQWWQKIIDILDVITLDNDIDYVVGAKTKIDDVIYYCLINESNLDDLIICSSTDEVTLKEVNDAEIVKKLLPRFYKSIRDAKIIEKCLKMNENA